MLWLYVIGLVIVSVLVAFLCRRFESRLSRREREREFSGHGLEVRLVSERVQRLREDYVTAVSTRSRDRSYRQQLHASASRALRGLAYFRRRETDQAHSPDHESHSAAPY